MANVELKTGMLGKENDGEVFVVVGDHLLYEGGCYEDIADLNDKLEWNDDGYITELYEGKCFDDVHKGGATLIWQRGDDETKPTETPKSITITIDEFLDVADKVNGEFMRVGEELDKGKGVFGGMSNAIMGLQNVTFAAMLADALFCKDK